MPKQSYIEMPWDEFITIALLHMPGSATFEYADPEYFNEYRSGERTSVDASQFVRIPIKSKD